MHTFDLHCFSHGNSTANISIKRRVMGEKKEEKGKKRSTIRKRYIGIKRHYGSTGSALAGMHGVWLGGLVMEFRSISPDVGVVLILRRFNQ